MNPQPLIGIAGRARAGKDTVAEALEPLGYKRVGFADELKRVALEIDPLIPGTEVSRHPDTLRSIVTVFGWEDAKDMYPGVRRFLQKLGTGIRERDPSFWVRAAMQRVHPNLADGYGVAVPDVRFPNEVDAIRKAGGIVVQVVRPGLPEDDHVSENALNGVHFDEVIMNNGDQEDLTDAVMQMVHSASRATPPRLVSAWE